MTPTMRATADCGSLERLRAADLGQRTSRFEIEVFRKRMLGEGINEITAALRYEGTIATYEVSRATATYMTSSDRCPKLINGRRCFLSWSTLRCRPSGSTVGVPQKETS